MSRLPRSLAHWEPELAALPRDVALALAPWLGRLAAAIGPFATLGGADAEPDGVGAIARRGPYERLLASEWLLAGELPDEFLRRAASGEHLFLTTSTRARSASSSAVALFDAGPSQLGAPRIAHIALLVVLARRARAAGARFAWGVLQRPDDALREGTDASAIEALLAARSALEPTQAQLDAWASRCDGEAWAIVGARAARLAASHGMHTITVDDPVALERRALSVRIARPRRGARELALPLLDDALGARLIRDPFGTAAAKPAVLGVPRDRSFALPADGRRLVVGTADGFLSWGLPNSPRGTVGNPRRMVLGRDEQLVAAGHKGRKLVAVAFEGGAFVIRGALEGTRDPKRPGFRVAPPEPDAPYPGIKSVVLNALAKPGGEPDCTWLHGRQLYSATRRSAQIVREGVLAFHPLRQGVLVVEGDHRGARVVVLRRDGGVDLVHDDRGVGHVVACIGSQDAGRGVIGYGWGSGSDRAWRVIRDLRGPGILIGAPQGTRVIGVHAGAADAELVIIERDRRRVTRLGRGGSTVALTASARIEHAVVAARGGLVAWRTSTGWIEVGSLQHGAIVFRVPPEEES